MENATDFLGVSGIWIVFLALVGSAILIVVGYLIFYRISINKSLNSGKPKKRISPKNIMIAVLGFLLILSIVFSIQRIAQDFKAQNTTQEYFNYAYEDRRGTAFDELFDDNDKAEQSGYLLSVWEEDGFEVCRLTGGRATSSLMPDNLIRIRYVYELPALAEGEHLDLSFTFLYQSALKPGEKFIGHSSEGSYNQIYITYNCRGQYNLKITAKLRIRTDKTDNISPFAKMLFEIGIYQN